MLLFVWVCLGTFPSAGHVCLLRALFEKPHEFALMHFEASYDFSNWLCKLFSSVAQKITLGSFINIFQLKLHRQHQPKLFSTSLSVENFCQIKKAHSLLLSPFYHPNMTEILLKRTENHRSSIQLIHPIQTL